jgi:hypothetical protein
MTDPFDDGDLFVSPAGDDSWTGAHPDPQDDDGPFRSIVRARDAIRDRLESGAFDGPTTVWIRGGRYPRAARAQRRASADCSPLDEPQALGRYPANEPLRFDPTDSAPVSYAAYPGETPVIDGGERIEDWEQTTVDGREVWRTSLEWVAAGEGAVRSLFIDGERRPRARWPTSGWFEVQDPDPVPEEHQRAIFNVGGERGRSFRVASAGGSGDDGDEHPIGDWHAVEGVDALIPQSWFQERSPLAWTEPESDRVGLELHPRGVLGGGERVAFENVREALSEPGEWYADPDSGELLYVPKSGETPDAVEAVVPRVDRLLEVGGEPETPVGHLTFRGLTFRHADWTHPGTIDPEVRISPDRRHPDGTEMVGRGHAFETGPATSVQAQDAIPGALDVADARHCGIVDCTVEHVGYYGISFRAGCRGDRVVGCDLRDLGAGGVKFDGVNVTHPSDQWVRDNRVTDCDIGDGGHVFPAGVGVLVRHGRGTTIAHNEIHDLYYSGISVGWTWGFADCVERDNRVERNHIHDLGKGLLSDMGGVYTLGVQPGTRVAENLIHGIERYDYGGDGLYPDEGSSNIVFEGNVVFDIDSAVHQHYGRENTVRHNVLVGGKDGVVGLTNPKTGGPFESLTLERNVLVGDPLVTGGYGHDTEAVAMTVDLNMLWNPSGDPGFNGDTNADGEPTLDLDAWRERGYDRHSVVADPEFVAVVGHDYGLPADSAAADLGIEVPSLADVGPRPPAERE